MLSPRAVGEAVKRFRRTRRMSQEKLAAAAGIHRTYMSAIERGKANISLGVAVRLAKSLKVRCSELVRMAEELSRDEK